MPPKIKELMTTLQKHGFENRGGRGSIETLSTKIQKLRLQYPDTQVAMLSTIK
jgi:hypothetical protein